MDIRLGTALALALFLLVIGLQGLLTPYPSNWLRLRWGLGQYVPIEWKCRIPKIVGSILIAGGVWVAAEFCVAVFGAGDHPIIASE